MYKNLKDLIEEIEIANKEVKKLQSRNEKRFKHINGKLSLLDDSSQKMKDDDISEICRETSCFGQKEALKKELTKAINGTNKNVTNLSTRIQVVEKFIMASEDVVNKYRPTETIIKKVSVNNFKDERYGEMPTSNPAIRLYNNLEEVFLFPNFVIRPTIYSTLYHSE